MSAFGADGFVESNHPHIVKMEIPLARLPESFDGLTIAQLSDFHYEDHFSVVPIRKAVEMVHSLRPDLIVLTGDFVTVPLIERPASLRRAASTAAPCAEILQELQAPMGRFAILGNHDAEAGATRIARTLREHGIPVLRNQSVPLERGQHRLWLAGIDDALRGPTWVRPLKRFRPTKPRSCWRMNQILPTSPRYRLSICSFPAIRMAARFGFRASAHPGSRRSRESIHADFTKWAISRCIRTSGSAPSAPRSASTARLKLL
jgi:predicted MPP superfamily phosphohydrolase